MLSTLDGERVICKNALDRLRKTVGIWLELAGERKVIMKARFMLLFLTASRLS